jgi:hypothetical protein
LDAFLSINQETITTASIRHLVLKFCLATHLHFRPVMLVLVATLKMSAMRAVRAGE